MEGNRCLWMFCQPQEKSAEKLGVDAMTEIFLLSKKLWCVKYVNHIDNGNTMVFTTLSAKLILMCSPFKQRADVGTGGTS